MPGPAISIRGLTVVRGKRPVLSGLDLDIPPGRITGLLGPSGCGKSTLMRSIVGVQKVRDGEVMVLGQRAGSPALRIRVAYLTQSPSVYLDLTVRENLRYFSTMLRVDHAAVSRVIRLVGLDEHGQSLGGELSGGQKARLSLATALLGRPELLVLDEPTVGQDPVLREELWATFHSLAGAGATLLVSSHVMEEADRCDRLILMREGVVIAHDTPAELRARTGANNLEDAFLTLVRARETA